MIFNTFPFLLFIIAIFCIYYFVLNENTKRQNILLLIASYFFYGWANWKILPLLIITTIFYYFLGLKIERLKDDKKKNIYTTTGVLFGVGSLTYFKYSNFFITSFAQLFESIGLQTNLHTFDIILPFGISFYTFRLLSYIIDLNRGKYEATTDFVVFATYVAFFPCILSGPIDRPNTLIPQLKSKRIFNYDLAIDGFSQILWGLFKKMVVADNIALVTNEIWENYSLFSGSTLLLGAILYVFQIYADFSGYSDMAIGIAKILGFKVTINFKYPLFALNIADYWRRWHISLTSWLTDYVFMPLNVRWRDWGNLGMIFAIVTNFVLCGLWHGANWTFVLFGLYHGLLFIPLILNGTFAKKTKIHLTKFGMPKIKDFGKMVVTFTLVTFGLIIFRAESINQFINYIKHICSSSILSIPKIIGYNNVTMLFSIVFIIIMITIEWQNKDKEYGLNISSMKYKFARYSIYLFLLILVYYFGADASSFIYFKF